MTIVFVVDNYSCTSNGTIISTLRFKNELERQGHIVRVVSNDTYGPNTYCLKTRRIPIVSSFAKRCNMTFAKFNKRVVADAIKDADVVHLLLPFYVQTKTLKLARKMGINVTAAFHLHPDNVLKNGGLKNPPPTMTKWVFERWRKILYDKVDDIHCPSQLIADELVKHNYTARLHVISNGISEEFQHIERVRPNVCLANPFRILMVGRFACEKRQDLLIDAVAMSKYADVIELTFAGSGPLEKKLCEQAKCLPNYPIFKFMLQKELHMVIKKSDIYVHCADVEVEGISCIEAFATGLVPVIGDSSLSATKQFAIMPESLFTAGDAGSLKERIEFWIENPKKLQTASLEYSEFAKGFTIKESAKKLVEMFEQSRLTFEKK